MGGIAGVQSISPGSRASGASVNGEPKLLGTIDFGALGSQVFTTAGSKSLGGLPFTLTGVDATNTWEFASGQGLRAVGGSSGAVYMDFDPGTFLGKTVGLESNVVGADLEIEDGTTSSGDVFSFNVGTDSDNFAIVQRRHNLLRAGMKNVAVFQANRDVTVSSSVDTRMLGMLINTSTVENRYSTAVASALEDPKKFSGYGTKNANFASNLFLNITFARIYFENFRNVYVRKMRLWQYAP